MDVIFLCAGYATRLYPLTKNQPKPLLEINGIPMLSYTLEKIEKFEQVKNIYIITNDKFYSHFTEWKNKNSFSKNVEIVNDRTKSDEDKLGAIGDMGYTIKEKGITSDILVIAGDNLFDFELEGFLKFANEKNSAGVIGAYDVKELELAKKYGILEVDEDWRVVAFLEKPENPPSTFASLAVYYFSKEGVSLIGKYLEEGNNPDQPGHYIRWLSENETVFGYVFKGHWFDIGDIGSYNNADQFFKNLARKE